MTAFFYVLTAIAAIVIGGFLERTAYAFPRSSFREILRPCCSSCGRELPAKAIIPIAGVFLLRCRCPHCAERQSLRVPLSEGIYALALLLLRAVYGSRYPFFLYAVLAALLLLLSLIDLDIKEVPHSLLLGVLLLGILTFVFSFFDFSESGTVWWEHLVGAFVISLPLFLLMMATGGVGGGDIKLMFVLGLLLGYKLVLLAFLFGVVLAALVAIILHFAFGKGGKFELPLVPFLSVGTLIALLCGEKVLALFF